MSEIRPSSRHANTLFTAAANDHGAEIKSPDKPRGNHVKLRHSLKNQTLTQES